MKVEKKQTELDENQAEDRIATLHSADKNAKIIRTALLAENTMLFSISPVIVRY